MQLRAGAARRLECSHCLVVVRDKDDFHSHVEAANGGILLIPCRECPAMFVDKERLAEHGASAHSARFLGTEYIDGRKIYLVGVLKTLSLSPTRGYIYVLVFSSLSTMVSMPLCSR